ncbi:hypothetical protein [Planctomycetes bacterium K23_9]|uniref:Uncharacterized protein n=1 Tax=Stieleria marina TaxID=1930275 RepID=A0A517P0D4_9BACT|nr:hypothetical protein K239x_48430 [Planctomycetes bacterium K23_9]
MNAEDFQNLYKLLRGSKSAFAVLDARTLFIEKNSIQSLERIEEARESYSQSRSRLMKSSAETQVDAKAPDAAKQIKRIERKQDKVKEILKAFDEMLPKLRKLADRDQAKAKEKPDTESTSSDVSESQQELQNGVYDRPANRDDVTKLFLGRFKEIDGDEQLAWIAKHFGFRPVESEEDIYPDSIYFIKIEDETFLVQTRSADEIQKGVALISIDSNVPMKTYTREAFVRMGSRRRMVLLTTEYKYAESEI